jgi:hypothetical protein
MVHSNHQRIYNITVKNVTIKADSIKVTYLSSVDKYLQCFKNCIVKYLFKDGSLCSKIHLDLQAHNTKLYH